MKSVTLTLLLAFGAHFLWAQTDADTTVYDVAESMPYPLLKACAPALHPGWNADSIRRCGEAQLLGILANNIRYPETARQKNTQGTVVASFIVEPSTGRMSGLSLLKDIGDGCGEEALRVLAALDAAGLRWQPAQRGGKPVRMRHSLPLRFRLQEALPYYLSEVGDTVYTVFDKAADFEGGVDSLLKFLVNRLDYPAEYEDSCKTGVIEMALLVRPDKTVKVDNQLDFNNLGLDFQWQASRLAARSAGMWIPAEYAGKPVASTLPLRVAFKSDSPKCKTANEHFDQAMLLADEGATLLEQDKADEAIKKWSDALALQPDNCEILYYRGSALLNLDRREEACKDYNRIKAILGITWFEQIRKLACGW
jgi:hypothetical protein